MFKKRFSLNIFILLVLIILLSFFVLGKDETPPSGMDDPPSYNNDQGSPDYTDPATANPDDYPEMKDDERAYGDILKNPSADYNNDINWDIVKGNNN